MPEAYLLDHIPDLPPCDGRRRISRSAISKFTVTAPVNCAGEWRHSYAIEALSPGPVAAKTRHRSSMIGS